MFFNLVIRANRDVEMPPARMLESTPDGIKKLFIKDGIYDLSSLSKLPIIDTQEFDSKDLDAVSKLGYMDMPSMNPRVSKPIASFPSKALLDMGLLQGRWASQHTCWNVIEGDPFYQLLHAGTGISMCLNSIKSIEFDNKFIAVMMPFNDKPEVDVLYQSIRQSVTNKGYRCQRVDELPSSSNIVDDIKKLIDSAAFVLVDITGLNLNVIYELGYAHGRDKKVLIISSEENRELPFDFSQLRIFLIKDQKAVLRYLKMRLINI